MTASRREIELPVFAVWGVITKVCPKAWWLVSGSNTRLADGFKRLV